MRAVLSINVSVEFFITIGPDPALDGAGLDQGYLDTAAGKLQAQSVRQPLQGEFTRHVGAPIGQGHQPEDGAVLDDSAIALVMHDGYEATGQLMPTEQIGLQLGAQHRWSSR